MPVVALLVPGGGDVHDPPLDARPPFPYDRIVTSEVSNDGSIFEHVGK